MFVNIRRAIDNMGPSKNFNMVDHLDTLHLKEFIKSKAEREELHHLQIVKANKIDTDICLRWVDLLHRMVK